jgi:hypothetical protein
MMATAVLGAELTGASRTGAEHAPNRPKWGVFFHSTSRITLPRFVRSSACTTSFLSSSISKRSTVRIASLGPGSINSLRMRLASSMARMRISMCWSGLFMGLVPIRVWGAFHFITRSPHWSLSASGVPKATKEIAPSPSRWLRLIAMGRSHGSRSAPPRPTQASKIAIRAS